jgi:hypothetical protein
LELFADLGLSQATATANAVGFDPGLGRSPGDRGGHNGYGRRAGMQSGLAVSRPPCSKPHLDRPSPRALVALALRRCGIFGSSSRHLSKPRSRNSPTATAFRISLPGVPARETANPSRRRGCLLTHLVIQRAQVLRDNRGSPLFLVAKLWVLMNVSSPFDHSCFDSGRRCVQSLVDRTRRRSHNFSCERALWDGPDQRAYAAGACPRNDVPTIEAAGRRGFGQKGRPSPVVSSSSRWRRSRRNGS